MRRVFSLLGVLACCVLVSSCQAPIDPDVASFLNNLNYMTGFERIAKASSASTMNYYQDGDFARVIGKTDETFLVDRTDREKQIYSSVIAYEGNQVKAVENGTLASMGLLSTKVNGSYDEGIRQYRQVTVDTAVDNDGINHEETQEESISSITYINKLTAYLFGDETSNAGGLFYGTFLQSQSRQFSQFMTLDEDKKTLTYDPKATGVDPSARKYVDIKLTVNEMGMLLTYEAESYDEENGIFTRFVQNCQYE